MPPLPSRCSTRAALVIAVAVIVPMLACSDDDSGSDQADRTTRTSTTLTTTTAAGTAPTPRATAREALVALLTAEQETDHETSFRLLSEEARKQYPDVPRWARRRSQLPPIIGFTLETSTSPAEAVAVVEHEPGLDPFIGLSAARERQTWRATEVGGGWLLEVEPEIEYLLPPDAAAREAALRWAQAVQACDEERAAAEQAIEEIYGTSTAAAELCNSPSTLAAGAVSELESGPASADLLAQYSADVFAWARVVTITGLEEDFGVVMAPTAEMWEVVGVQD